MANKSKKQKARERELQRQLNQQSQQKPPVGEKPVTFQEAETEQPEPRPQRQMTVQEQAAAAIAEIHEAEEMAEQQKNLAKEQEQLQNLEPSLPDTPPEQLENTVPQSEKASPEQPSQSLEDEGRKVPLMEDLTVGELADAIRERCQYQGSVETIIKSMCEGMPGVLPSITRWFVEGYSPVDMIYERLMQDFYIESLVPSLYMLMGGDVKNTRYASQVAIGLTTYIVILELPMRMMADKAKVEEEAKQAEIWTPEQSQLVLPVTVE